MKAFVYDKYGSPDVLHLTELPKPVPEDDQILIKIHAVSINASEREGLIGKPLYARIGGLPKNNILGSDIAGRVEAVGKDNMQFQVGDEVFGEIPGYHGGFAGYICTRGKTMMLKPTSMTFEEASAIPRGGVIAINAIHKKGEIQAGQQVLINGAGGSGGTFAIQLAKMLSGGVTGVDNAHKLDFMRSIGADHIIDYKREDFTKNGKQYDLILDLIAHRSVFAYARALKPNGKSFFVGGSMSTLFQVLLLGPLVRRFTGKQVQILVVPQNREDLMAITQLCVAGKIRPVIDKQYKFHQIPEAMGYVSDGYAKGKVVITIA